MVATDSTATRSLTGRAAVVVGGGTGIGYAVAVALAEAGAAVVINGRDAEALDRAVAEITAVPGRTAIAIAGSAAEQDVADALIGACLDTHGGIDVLINCAGTPEPPGSSILTVAPEQWRALLDAHLTTVFTTCRAAAPHMVARGRGSIVTTGSFAYLGDFGGTGYAAGKGAVASLTLAMAAELREHGVRANVVCPGARTRLSTGPAYEAHIEDLHRRGILDELTRAGALDAPPAAYVAQLYRYLADDRSAAVTGRILIGAGNFVGAFERPRTTVIGYRDHHDAAPWTVEELDTLLAPDPAPAG